MALAIASSQLLLVLPLFMGFNLVFEALEYVWGQGRCGTSTKILY